MNNNLIALAISPADLQNIMVALNTMIETPGRCTWEEKCVLFNLGNLLIFQSQNQPQGETEHAPTENNVNGNPAVADDNPGDSGGSGKDN